MPKYITGQQYLEDLSYCRGLLDSFSSNYSLALKLFPAKVQDQVSVFYAFLRYADELIDNPEKDFPGRSHGSLGAFVDEWKSLLEGQRDWSTAHSVMRATHQLFEQHSIDLGYLGDFIEAMQQDQTQQRYANYRELEEYMWGSAGIVGHVMAHILGYTDPTALNKAKSLGEAMQLANFLRDIDEDYQQRGRIYLPQDAMVKFQVSEDMLSDQRATPELRSLLRYYVRHTEQLFDEGDSGIPLLVQGRSAVAAASRIYRANLNILAGREYDPFGPTIRVPRWKKILLISISVFS